MNIWNSELETSIRTYSKNPRNLGAPQNVFHYHIHLSTVKAKRRESRLTCEDEGYVDQTVNKFLYTVTRTPRLADYVWHLRVSCWNVENAENENYDQKVEFDGDLVRGLVGTRSGYSEEEKSTWLNDLERDNSDAWLALLLPQLIELRNLHLVWPYGSQYVLEMLQKAAIEEEAVFPHLEEAYAASEA
ncbi:uncharacterized protein N7477_002977 [Penicillium maclennaniae]|uniref:uncharacterized protein n=1 Tax=Penicillium maclennaniae TaxID=1343394 RepID=UPI0025401F3D|nr:uncharacterized protein N7477_002977 [Penicillium maclennaniae]KAJ5677344.1 hypothetical protein N7477_002977 [Penicillium maclennaniae]